MIRGSQYVLAILLCVYIAIGSMWVQVTPLQGIQLPDNVPASLASETRMYGLGPDEKEHQLYIESLAGGKGIPKPSPEKRSDSDQYVSYQAQHPPLFYAAASVPWKFMSGLSPEIRIMTIRWMCLLLGAVTIGYSFCIARMAFKSDVAGFVCSGVVAFTPMFGHMHGNISNEPMAMALVAASLYNGMIAKEKGESMRFIVAGILFGLALVTRLTAGIWLPGLLIMSLSRKTLMKHGIRMIPGIMFPLIFWMIMNQLTLGSPLIRTFHRPLLDTSHSIGQLISTGIQVPGAGVTLNVPVILLWVGGCATIPMWLMQFHMGIDLVTWSAISIVMALAIVLINLDQFSKVRRGISTHTPNESISVRVAGLIAVVLAVFGLLQQLLYSDWDVVFSTGRYSIAAAIGGALLVSGAIDRISKRKASGIFAAVFILALVSFDIYSTTTVRAFYREKPTQDAIQYVEKAG